MSLAHIVLMKLVLCLMTGQQSVITAGGILINLAL